MTAPLLQTKLYIPAPRPDFVPRPRLIAQLNQGFERKLTLISAPAGFGKTTLLSSWIAQINAPVAWLSLDEADNDLSRFLTYMIAALQRLDPDLGRSTRLMLDAPTPLAIPALMTPLINDFAASASSMGLVLDDYHLIETLDIHEGLAFLLEHLPPNLHLTLASRDDPLLPLPRLRIRAELTELRATDLAFTAAEIATFFKAVIGLDISAEAISAIEARTEGWAAGLQVAGLSMQQRDEAGINRFLQDFTGSHRYVLDYLADEVLQQQTSVIRDFLLQTSILARLSASLCNAVTGRTDAQAILQQLEAANLFLVPLDEARHWYRYHHLFHEFLRHQLQQQAPDSQNDLYQRASRWYEAANLSGEAVSMALTAADFERAADLIEAMIRTTAWERGQWLQQFQWFEMLPDAIIRPRPLLSLYYGWGLMTQGEVEHAERWLQISEQALALDGPEANSILGRAAVVRATITRLRGHWRDTITLSRQALDQLPPDFAFWRASTSLNLGTLYFLGDDEAAADQMLRQARADAQVADNVSNEVVALGYLAELKIRNSQLGEAENLYRQAVTLWQSQQGSRFIVAAGMPQVGLGSLYLAWNRLEAAIEFLEEGLALGDQVNNLLTRIAAHVSLARLHQARRDSEAALRHIQVVQALSQIPRLTWTWLTVPLSAWLVRLWLGQGQLDRAATVAAEIADETPSLPAIWQEGLGLARARVHLAQGEYQSALSLLQPMSGHAAQAGRLISQVELSLLQAVAFFSSDRRDEALVQLNEAVTLAESAGIIGLFAEMGAPIRDLLPRLAAQGVAPAYVRTLLAALKSPAAVTPRTSPLLLDPLTKRELEVLRLIAAGLTNQEIADQLVIAHGTVRQHINRIYSKLDVKTRARAILKAQELGLVQPL